MEPGTIAITDSETYQTLLAPLRTRLATCMVRRTRQEVLSQLPARTDTRIPIEMTAEQMDEHDALNMPIAQILGRAKRRPLAQPEFLRLMTLLTTQRIIANGLAQLRFEQIWPDLSRIERPTDATLRGLASPKLVELRELIGQLALAEGRKVPPETASTLAALFSGMAQLLEAAATPPMKEGRPVGRRSAGTKRSR